MNERPVLDRNPVSGGKIEMTDRIAYFLDTGKVMSAPTAIKKAAAIATISDDTKIEANFVCSEKQKLISNLSTILIFEIFLQTILGNL